MRNIKLTVEYDGTSYHGWQTQNNSVAVQDIIQKSIEKLTGEECSLIGSSRTDAGVHALGHVSNFTTNCTIPADRFPYAINSFLPDDIVVKNAEEVSMDFHARFWAKGKKYRYLIHNHVYRSALLRNRAYHVRYPMDFEAMQKASLYFLGEHDFSAFMATGGSAKTTVRNITDVLLIKKDDVIQFEITGNGFLYNMVRIIAGTLVYVGLGKIAPEDITGIIEGRDRRKAGKTAPSHGLYLVEVYY